MMPSMLVIPSGPGRSTADGRAAARDGTSSGGDRRPRTGGIVAWPGWTPVGSRRSRMETFVVRVWRPAEGQVAGGAPGDLRGIVLHPSSGLETPFSSEAELLE